MILLTLGYSFRNRRGTLGPRVLTVKAGLDLLLLRARRRARALEAGWFLLGAEALVLLLWILGRSEPEAGRHGGLGLLAAVAGGAAATLRILQRRTRREISELEAIERTADDDGP